MALVACGKFVAVGFEGSSLNTQHTQDKKKEATEAHELALDKLPKYIMGWQFLELKRD